MKQVEFTEKQSVVQVHVYDGLLKIYEISQVIHYDIGIHTHVYFGCSCHIAVIVHCICMFVILQNYVLIYRIYNITIFIMPVLFWVTLLQFLAHKLPFGLRKYKSWQFRKWKKRKVTCS